jgi:ribonuclease-3
MDQAAVDNCQKALGHKFSDVSLLSQALTHASAASTRVSSNERLEFLGDAVLSLVVCHELYKNTDELLEGEMTKIKSTVVSGATCASIARRLGLGEMVAVGKGLSAGSGPPPSVLGALLEAIIGAIYLDGGLRAARKFILANFRPQIREAMATDHQQNYKSMLQQYSHRRWGSTPEYTLLDEKGPDHSKAFETAVTIDGVHFKSAWGVTKKDAEQEAARQALIELGALEDKEAS